MKPKESDSAIGILLHDFLKRHPAFSANPLGDWAELVGEQVARYSQPRSLKKKVLEVVAYNSVWKHNLDLYKHAIIEKINSKRPDDPLVEKIVVKVGELPEAPGVLNPYHEQLEKLSAKAARAPKKKKAPARPLSPEEKALLKELSDPEIRAIGSRILKRACEEDL